jgi:ribulose 1,5-bisphosphate synthetase/thiazole synthase
MGWSSCSRCSRPGCRDERATCDTIIVGAGTNGCLRANRLSADARRRVLIEPRHCGAMNH